MNSWLIPAHLAMVLVFTTGCGEDITPAKTCSELDKIACKRALECYTPEQLEMFGLESEAQCVTEREQRRMADTGLDCGQFTAERSNCAEGERYDADKADSCVQLIAGLSCTDWLDDSTPGVCNEICAPAAAP